MQLCVIFMVVSGSFLTQVDTKFYLEKTVEYEGLKQVTLFECDSAGMHSVKCNPVESFEKKQYLQEVVNFYGVNDLDLLKGNTIEIDSIVYIQQIVPRVLTVGVEPMNYHKPNFKPACADTAYIREKASRHLGRFINSASDEFKALIFSYLSLNNVGYFNAFTANTPELFASFADILKAVIDASRFNEEKIMAEVSILDSNLPENPANRPQSKVLTRVLSRVFAQARTQSKSISKAACASIPKIISRCTSWSVSSSSFQPQAQSGTQSWLRGKASRQTRHSASATSPSTPHQYSVQSMSSQPRRISEAAFQLKMDLMDATVYLALKMFDPCFILDYTEEEKEQASSACTLYCQFLSMTMQVYEQVYSERCKDLHKGKCVNKMCVCWPRAGYAQIPVNMVFCNNAFRLHMYDVTS